MTAIREALQELVRLHDETWLHEEADAYTSHHSAMQNAWKTARAALSQEVPQEPAPAGYVLVDLNEYDGDDPRADADTDRWMAAADAFVKANPHNMRGLAEWECQMRAAINVLATPQVKVAAQGPIRPEQPARSVQVAPAAAAPSGELPPLPESFAQYIADNYNGEVVFSNPRWHAERIWRSAAWHMRSYAKAAREPLTDEKIRELGKGAFGIDIALDGNLMKFARAIEAARGEK